MNPIALFYDIIFMFEIMIFLHSAANAKTASFVHAFKCLHARLSANARWFPFVLTLSQAKLSDFIARNACDVFGLPNLIKLFHN